MTEERKGVPYETTAALLEAIAMAVRGIDSIPLERRNSEAFLGILKEALPVAAVEVHEKPDLLPQLQELYGMLVRLLQGVEERRKAMFGSGSHKPPTPQKPS